MCLGRQRPSRCIQQGLLLRQSLRQCKPSWSVRAEDRICRTSVLSSVLHTQVGLMLPLVESRPSPTDPMRLGAKAYLPSLFSAHRNLVWRATWRFRSCSSSNHTANMLSVACNDSSCHLTEFASTAGLLILTGSPLSPFGLEEAGMMFTTMPCHNRSQVSSPALASEHDTA